MRHDLWEATLQYPPSIPILEEPVLFDLALRFYNTCGVALVIVEQDPNIVVYRCHDLGRDRVEDWVEVGIGEGLLDPLVEEVVY